MQLITAVKGQAIHGVERLVSRRSGLLQFFVFFMISKFLWVSWCKHGWLFAAWGKQGCQKNCMVACNPECKHWTVKMTIEPWEQWIPNKVQRQKQVKVSEKQLTEFSAALSQQLTAVPAGHHIGPKVLAWCCCSSIAKGRSWRNQKRLGWHASGICASPLLPLTFHNPEAPVFS